MENSNEIIKIENIKKSYITQSETLEVLKGINLKVDRGEIITIMGPSGCGKTTLLNILGLLEEYDSGSYQIAGIEISSLTPKEKQLIRLEKIGFVFQTFNLIQSLTVEQNVELPMALMHVSQAEQHATCKQLLEFFAIDKKSKNYPFQLSIGEQQRVAIARALVNKPKIVLCDEPTGNLDKDNGEIIINYLEELVKKTQTTILIVTHNPAIKRISSKNYILEKGILKLEEN
jgi:putative ABC transport system ATP-binding protein